MNLLPQVHKKDGKTEEFNDKAIYTSLLKETSLTPSQAKHICELTTRRIISHNIKWLSGPHVREICCSILAEHGYTKERLQYTRIGIPYYELKQLLINNKYRREIDNYWILTTEVIKEYKEVKKLIEGME